MKSRTHAEHIHHAAALCDIHLQRIIDRAMKAIHSEEVSDCFTDIEMCFTLQNCLSLLQERQPAVTSRVLIQASFQLAKELNYNLGNSESETLFGMLNCLYREELALRKATACSKSVELRKSVKPVAA